MCFNCHVEIAEDVLGKFQCLKKFLSFEQVEEIDFLEIWDGVGRLIMIIIPTHQSVHPFNLTVYFGSEIFWFFGVPSECKTKERSKKKQAKQNKKI